MYEGINVGDKDFSALIAKMKEAGVTVVYYGGLHTEAGLIMRQARRPGRQGNAGHVGGWHRVERARLDRRRCGRRDSDDVRLPIRATIRTHKELVEKFRAAGFEPEAYTLYSYAAVQALAGAANAAKTLDTQEVAKTLKAGTYPTVLGDMSFDEKGDPKLPGYIMYEWKKGDDGKYTYVPQ